MCASSYQDFVARVDLDAKSQSDLYDLFRVGSKMLEHPRTRETLRLAGAWAKEITGCIVRAAYVLADDRLVRYSGKANRRLDLLVEARAGKSGVLENGDVWRYALFFRETGKVRGAFVLQAAAEPSRNEMFMLHALAEPTGAALATAELLKRERRQTRELRQRYEAQAGSNRTMTATIVRLNAHQDIRDSIVAAAGTGNGEAQIVEALSAITRRSVVLQDSFGNERAFVGVGGAASPSSSPTTATSRRSRSGSVATSQTTSSPALRSSTRPPVPRPSISISAGRNALCSSPGSTRRRTASTSGLRYATNLQPCVCRP